MCATIITSNENITPTIPQTKPAVASFLPCSPAFPLPITEKTMARTPKSKPTLL